MTPKQTLLVFSALLLVTTSGCSGSRMRNLISRSDYMTAEELEAQDSLTAEREESSREKALAAADSEIASRKRTETLVSSGRIVDEADESETADGDASKAAPRKSFMNIAGLFKRNKDEAEVSPDPFVEIAEPAAVKKADEERESEAKTISSTDSELKVQKFENTIAALEKEAESVFDEASPIIVEAAKTASLSSDAADKSLSAQDVTQSTGTFADFMAERREEVKTTVDEDISKVTESIDAVAKANDSTVSAFDAILETDAPESSTSAFAEELFTSLDEIKANVNSTPTQTKDAAESMFEEITQSTISTATVPAQQAGDAFAEASEKHGFAKLNQRDPWAAFDSKKEDAESAIARQQEPQPSSDGFVWSSQAVSADNSDSGRQAMHMATNAFAFDATTRGKDSPFTQVSASEVSNELDDFDSSASAPGLVIPGGTSQPVSDFDDTANDFEASTSDELISDDPFLNDPFADVPAADSPSATPAAASVGPRWSARSWFLLIGCILVICLLILPDRQKRFNA